METILGLGSVKNKGQDKGNGNGIRVRVRVGLRIINNIINIVFLQNYILHCQQKYYLISNSNCHNIDQSDIKWSNLYYSILTLRIKGKNNWSSDDWNE